MIIKINYLLYHAQCYSFQRFIVCESYVVYKETKEVMFLVISFCEPKFKILNTMSVLKQENSY